MNVLTFERRTLLSEKRTLAKDMLSAISGYCTDKRFIGHDGREYLIGRGVKKPRRKTWLT
jgi:hypothetical protein